MELELLHSLGCTNIYIYIHTHFWLEQISVPMFSGWTWSWDLRVPFDIPINAILPVLNGCSSVACCTRSPILYLLLPKFSSKSNPMMPMINFLHIKHECWRSYGNQLLHRFFFGMCQWTYGRRKTLQVHPGPVHWEEFVALVAVLSDAIKDGKSFFYRWTFWFKPPFFLGISQLRVKCLQLFFFGVGSWCLKLKGVTALGTLLSLDLESFRDLMVAKSINTLIGVWRCTTRCLLCLA